MHANTLPKASYEMMQQRVFASSKQISNNY